MTIKISVERTQSLVTHELAQLEVAQAHGNANAAWQSFERIDILSKRVGMMHLQSHWWMLRYASSLRDYNEVLGQLLRLALAPIGNLTGSLPFGNTGRANFSAFLPMDISVDLHAQITKP